jgi:hypothetical protein
MMISPALMVRINVLFVVMALIPVVMGFRPYGVAFWLVVASIAAANGLFHLWALLRTRRYFARRRHWVRCLFPASGVRLYLFLEDGPREPSSAFASGRHWPGIQCLCSVESSPSGEITHLERNKSANIWSNMHPSRRRESHDESPPS